MKINLKFKFALIMVILSLFCVGTVGLIMLSKARESIGGLAIQYAKSASEASASNIAKFLEPYWFTAETIGHVMERYEDLQPAARRSFFNSVLESMVKENKDMLGAWCNWEPNTLEGDDSQYIGVPGSEPDGRFVPYWVRTSSGINVETLVDYNKPGDGNYYLLAKNSGRTTLLDPFSYKIDGKDVLVTSLAVPIRSKKGTVLGVVGVDILVDDIQKIAQINKPYDDALTAVFSHDGTIASHFEPSHIGKKLLESKSDVAMLGSHLENYLKALKEGKPYSLVQYVPEIKSDLTFFFSPIRIDKSETPWSFAVAI
ncbi:MAG: hypothetical protein LBH25_12275 [Fibromonadaceae bacterium]|jgi:methyl-accepting chemotaxis protein|nr:hypothetical protein [Fibromonadaceae bacterium]